MIAVIATLAGFNHLIVFLLAAQVVANDAKRGHIHCAPKERPRAPTNTFRRLRGFILAVPSVKINTIKTIRKLENEKMRYVFSVETDTLCVRRRA